MNSDNFPSYRLFSVIPLHATGIKMIPVSYIKNPKNTVNICVDATNISHYSLLMQFEYL